MCVSLSLIDLYYLSISLSSIYIISLSLSLSLESIAA